ncbi:MAG: asparagine synthase, partial [Nitrosopumilaceae archaeon]
ECHNRDWVPDQEYLFGRAIKFDWDTIYNYLGPYFSNPLNPLQQVMLADYNGKLLFDFIPTGKAIFEYYGLHGLQIFLDPNVISFALHIPITQKYDAKNQKGKMVLRKIARRLGIAHIDEKKGFSPDLLFDWKKHGKKICQTYLLDKNSNIFTKKLINYNWVLRAIERVENDGDIRYLNRLISIFALEIWYGIFINGELNPAKKLS